MKAEGGQKWPDSVTVSRGGGRGGVGGPTFDVTSTSFNLLQISWRWYPICDVASEGAPLSHWLALFCFLD